MSAATAEEALAVFEVVERIDVLFADINLRSDVHSGLDVAKQARKRQPDIAVLYATGQAVTDGTRAMMVENSAVLEKPYTIEQLQTSLSVHFRIKPRSRT